MPAYPQPLPERGQSEQRTPSLRGLTLLDALVIAALPVAQAQLQTVEASFVNSPPVTHHGSPAQVAALTFDIAEALLAERITRLGQPATAAA